MLKLKAILMFFLILSLTACSITLPSFSGTRKAAGWNYIEYDMSNAIEERMYLPYSATKTLDGTCIVRFHVADLKVKDFEDKLVIEYRPLWLLNQKDDPGQLYIITLHRERDNVFKTKDADCQKAFVEYANKSKWALVKPLDTWKGLVISKKHNIAVLTQKETTSVGLARSGNTAVLNVFGYVYDPKEFEAAKIPCHTFFCEGKEEYYKTIHRLVTKEVNKQSLCDPLMTFNTALLLSKQGGTIWDRIFFAATKCKEYKEELFDCVHSDREDKPRVLKGNARRINTVEGCERFYDFLKESYRKFKTENNIGGKDGA